MNRLIVGVYQIITGVFGILLIGLSYFAKSDIYTGNQLITSQVLTGSLLFILLAWSGYGMIKSNVRAKSVSIFLQAIQIPIIYFGSYIYKFTSAGFLSAGFNNKDFVFLYKLQPIDFTISANLAHETIYMVHIVPIVFLILLIRAK